MSNTSSPGKTPTKDVKATTVAAAESVKDEALKIGESARQTGESLVREKAEEAREQITAQSDSVESAVDDIASTLGEHSDTLGQYASEFAGTLSSFNDRLRTSSLDEMASDARRIARENPAMFMLGAVAIGTIAARFFQASSPSRNQRSVFWAERKGRCDPISISTIWCASLFDCKFRRVLIMNDNIAGLKTNENQTDLSSEPKSTSGLLAQLMEDVSGLVQTEMSLAKAEVNQSVSDVKTGLSSLATGLAVLIPGVALLVVALVLIIEAFTGLEAWSSTLLVGLIVTVIGAVLLSTAKAKLSAENMLPSRTQASIQKDAELVERKVS